MSELVKHVDDSSFEQEVLNSGVPVLVDFWAPWCGPCRSIAPMIDQIAEEYNGKLAVCKVNVDESSEVAAQFGIRGIPTIILFKNGKVVNQVVGAVPKTQLESMIQTVV